MFGAASGLLRSLRVPSLSSPGAATSPCAVVAPLTLVPQQQVRWASKKSGGKTQNGRDSNPKYRGFKKGNGALALKGNIILTQKGTRWFPGFGTHMGSNHTIHATEQGYVKLTRKVWNRKNGKVMKVRKYVSITQEKTETPVQDIR